MGTWYERRGAGEPLVLLHPGMADARAFDPNIDALAERFQVYTPERRGHGRTPDVDGPITYDGMARDTIEFLQTIVGGPAHLLGCSDGAIVALQTALLRPDFVRRLVLVAGPTLTACDLARIASRTLVMIGDDDEVSLEHAAELYRGIPDAELAVVPGTSHGLLVEKPALCNAIVLDFLTKDPVPQMAPIRRA
jgi:pimeloyl-ACP methyl ester carboxylesterase